MKLLASILFFFVLVSCSTTATHLSRSPEFGIAGNAMVGDPVYEFNAIGRKTIDHYNGTVYGGSGLSRELIYSGVSNNQLRLTYREYAAQAQTTRTANYIRPAFTQDVQYDFTGEPITLNFQTVKIIVLSANSASIDYIVESGFRDEAEWEQLQAKQLKGRNPRDIECSNARYAPPERKCRR